MNVSRPAARMPCLRRNRRRRKTAVLTSRRRKNCILPTSTTQASEVFLGAISKLGLNDLGKPTMPQGNNAELHPGCGLRTNFAAVFATGGDNLEGGFVSFSEAGTALATYSFGDQTTDGSGPETALVGDGTGNFYGTTAFAELAKSARSIKSRPLPARVAARRRRSTLSPPQRGRRLVQTIWCWVRTAISTAQPLPAGPTVAAWCFK